MGRLKHSISASRLLFICALLSIVTVAVGVICAFVCMNNFDALKAATGDDVSLSAVSSAVSSSIWAVTAILIVLGIMVAVIYLINMKTIVRPTLEMEAHFSGIARGDLHTKCPLQEGTNEIGRLVASANMMQASFNRYINSIETVLWALAQGQLSVKTDQDFLGDFTRIRDALEQITTSFGDSFAEINSASAEMYSGAEQISIGAATLSEGSSEQAATIEELVSTMSEVSQRVAETVVSAEKVRTAAGDMMDSIRSGGEALSTLTAAIEKTGEYSEDISKIIKVIDGIAFQTNILALNAAVEAARAGENGAAFGVVADEVRLLANQTAENAKSITVLIEEMLKSLANGVGRARATEGSLKAIVVDAGNVQELVDKITSAMESDSAAMEEALTGLEQLSAVVETNSATAEESAAASEEIAAQSFAVMEMVGKFKK